MDKRARLTCFLVQRLAHDSWHSGANLQSKMKIMTNRQRAQSLEQITILQTLSKNTFVVLEKTKGVANIVSPRDFLNLTVVRHLQDGRRLVRPWRALPPCRHAILPCHPAGMLSCHATLPACYPAMPPCRHAILPCHPVCFLLHFAGRFTSVIFTSFCMCIHSFRAPLRKNL
jgi:hypothetical protein